MTKNDVNVQDEFFRLFNELPEPTLTVDSNMHVVQCNNSASELFGYRVAELLGQDFHLLIPERSRDNHRELSKRFMAQKTGRPMSDSINIVGRHSDGSEIPLAIMLFNHQHKDEPLYTCILKDMTHWKRIERRLENELKKERHSARIDALTGLPNRRYFYEVAQSELKRFERYKHCFSVVYIDLDNFKFINDNLGHAAGDSVLRETALMLQKLLRPADFSARIGGDEFVILLPETGAAEALSMIQRVKNTLTGMFRSNDWEITCSVGIVTINQHCPSLDNIVDTADRLMYKVKANGKDAILSSTATD